MSEDWYKGWKNLWSGDAEVEEIEIDIVEPEPLEEEIEEEEG